MNDQMLSRGGIQFNNNNNNKNQLDIMLAKSMHFYHLAGSSPSALVNQSVGDVGAFVHHL